MAMLLRGVLVEYSGAFLGPIPNIVVFQFNPEQLARTITIPPRNDSNDAQRPQRETGATVAPPTESFTITAHFSAADDLGRGGALSAIPRVFGIGPQLAALEKMVVPPKTPGGLIGAAIDAIGSALSGDDEKPATRLVPRERVPKILFIWGAARILPVSVTSMTITEQQFDFLLNPVQAEVAIGLEVASAPPDSDAVAQGALTYTNMVKDTQATLNLVKAAELALDIVPF
jgi:hypothetical protein